MISKVKKEEEQGHVYRKGGDHRFASKWVMAKKVEIADLHWKTYIYKALIFFKKCIYIYILKDVVTFY